MPNNSCSNVRPVPAGGGRRFPWYRSLIATTSTCALALVLSISGCETSNTAARAPGVAPMPTYTGPSYMRGTVGSMVRLRPGTDLPMLVNGYGIVVNLDGTGSTSAPPALRQALINQMKKYGLGSARMHTLDMPPERVLADPNTAVVRIDGLVPAGATKGMRFDVLVSAIDSQTTSLAGGTLWTASLGINGANQAFRFIREQATAYGPIYDNPYKIQPDSGELEEFGQQQAIVVAGGEVTAPRELELVLNQSSFSRCRAIADRINERFGRADDRKPLAHPLTDQLIEINVPPRHQHDPEELVDLINHLYLQSGGGFEKAQAQRLASILREQPEAERSVRFAWQSLGRPIIETLRQYYDDPQLHLRLTALEAGAWLDDERASQSLSELATSPDPAIRARVAEALVLLPRSIKGGRTLRELLDDEVTGVRIAAYESLAAINDRFISDGRVVVLDKQGTDVKYVIDTVPAAKPLVYVTQVGVPRIVIFKPDLGFETPLLARFWDNRLMLSMEPDQGHVNIFYQPRQKNSSEASESIRLKAVPDLKTLIYLLGHHATPELPTEGLGLTYSQTVDVVYQMCIRGDVEAPIEVVVSALAKQVADVDEANSMRERPESRPDSQSDDNLGVDSPGVAPVPKGRPDTTYPSTDAQTTSSR